MSSKLQQFTSQSKFKVDSALAARWEHKAGYYGERPIKTQIANARRTASILQKATSHFCNIRPEQELAFKAAASAMQRLAEELTPLVPWAKAYRLFCVGENERARLEALETIAVARWGADISALQFEADLVQELASQDGQLAFAQWVHSMGEHMNVQLERISCCMEKLQPGSDQRERMAASVQEGERSTDFKWESMRGLTVICGWRTYERCLEHRKDVAITVVKQEQRITA